MPVTAYFRFTRQLWRDGNFSIDVRRLARLERDALRNTHALSAFGFNNLS